MQLTTRFSDALAYACQLHAAQVRKGSGVPYVAHLLAVASLALEHGADEDQAIAAVLHDAVEDQGGAPVLAEIARRFGASVAAIVDGCSDTDLVPKPPWRSAKSSSWPGFRGPAMACNSFRRPTSCTTCGRSSQISAATAMRFGRGSPAARMARCGTTARWSRHLRRRCAALVEELDRAVSELERMVAAAE